MILTRLTCKSSSSNETFTFVGKCNCYDLLLTGHCRTIQSNINKLDFVNQSYDYRPNWTPLSPVAINYKDLPTE